LKNESYAKRIADIAERFDCSLYWTKLYKHFSMQNFLT